MTTPKEVEAVYKKYRTKYFKKYFLGRNINEAMYESSRMIILNLTAVQTKLCVLIDCLNVLRRDKELFSKLDSETRRIMKTNIIGYKVINRDLENILKPILASLNGEM
ncbi:MAG: hypothetical protein NC408_09235 [Candidatus Gastranaerophilales bacterium]|nr:hypothetical protein [Candidatus Gastranaerophilales bacterium]MCM1073739.1 hypothetical protein [Bacteroides sp.]